MSRHADGHAKERANAARFDGPAQVCIGPASQSLRLRDVVDDPIMAAASASLLRPNHVLSAPYSEEQSRRCSTDTMLAEIKDAMSEEKLATAIRRRLLTWVEAGHPGEGETLRAKRKKRRAEREADEISSRASARSSVSVGVTTPVCGEEGGDPEPEAGSQNGKEGSAPNTQGECLLNGIEERLPSAFRFQANTALASAYYHRDTRTEENAIRGPTPSALLQTSRGKATLAARGTSMTDSSRSEHPAVVVCIEVYARPTRTMWAKERYDHLSGADLYKKANKASSADNKLSRQGPFGPLELAQKVEILSTSSLQDLRDVIVCRLDDFPEQIARPGGGNSQGKEERGPQMPKYTGRKRKTDSCFLIGKDLYSEGSSKQGSYADLVSEHFAKQASSGSKTKPSVASSKSMAQVRLDELTLCTGQLYWFLHQGSCEHLWAITSVRALRNQEKMAAPMCTFLAYGSVIRPLIRWTRPNAKTESYALGTCEICSDRHACMVVLGGADAHIPLAHPREGDEQPAIAMPGLDASNMSICEVCYNTMIDAPLPSLQETMDRAGTWWSADMVRAPWASDGGENWTVIPALE